MHLSNKLKNAVLTFSLLAAHLFVFNLLYTFRYPLKEAMFFTSHWAQIPYTGHLLDYVKTYFSPISDEANFYEWSTVVLGKNFEADYPFEKRDVSVVHSYFQTLPQKHLPYRDISFEYPPLLIFPMLLPRILANNYVEYCRYLAALLSLVYLCILFTAYKIWKEIPSIDRISFSKFLLYSLLAILLLGQIFVTRLDIFPNFVYLMGIYSFLKKRWYQSFFWIAVGFFTKGYSILLAPLFSIMLLKQKKYKVLTFCLLGISFLIIGGNFLLGYITQGHYFDSLKFHAIRGLQIESTYSTFWMLLGPLLGERLFCYSDHNCANLGSAHIHWILMGSKIIFPLFLACFYLYLSKKIYKKPITSSEQNVIILESSCLLLFLSILTFKVFSAQFIIWLIPIYFLMPLAKQKGFVIWFFISLLLTQIFFPSFYWTLGDTLHPFGEGLIFIRNLILIFLFIELFRNSKLRQLNSH